MRVIFVGMHNKPDKIPLCSSTKSGKLLSEMKSAEWESPLMHEAETILNHTK